MSTIPVDQMTVDQMAGRLTAAEQLIARLRDQLDQDDTNGADFVDEMTGALQHFDAATGGPPRRIYRVRITRVTTATVAARSAGEARAYVSQEAGDRYEHIDARVLDAAAMAPGTVPDFRTPDDFDEEL